MADSRDAAAGLPPETYVHKGNPVVNEVRRLLMRLSTQLHTHALDLARLEPQAGSAGYSVDLVRSLRVGAREAEAAPRVPRMPFAVLPRVDQPDLDSGTGPLAPYCEVSKDQAGWSNDFSVSVLGAPVALPAPTLAHPVLESASITSFASDVHPSGGCVLEAARTLLPDSARVYELTTAPPILPEPDKTRPPSRARMLVLPRVRPVPERIMSEVALERRCAHLPGLDTASGRAAHLMTRQLLAAAAGAGVSEQEITIIGIYRRVPIGAAARMAFDDRTNALCLTLRSDAARVVQSQGTQVVSLVFGRVQANGRLVRALVPAPPASR